MKSLGCLLLTLLLLLSAAVYADCPDCYKDQQPLDPARGLSADGRVKVLVGASSESWANPPGTTTADPFLATAAARGMSMWNAATDSSGNRTNYYFDTISGTQPVSSVDIIIVKTPRLRSDGSDNDPARMETGGTRPYKLMVREDMLAKMSASDLAGLFAHELGHRIGLGNKNCPGTIMQQADPQANGTIKMRQATVGAQDVRMSRINYSAATRGTCLQQDPKSSFLAPSGSTGGACMDSDGDGVTTCAGDCDDSDPYHTTNCGSGCNLEACWSVEGCTECDLNICRCTEVWGQPFSPVVIDVAGDGFDLTDKTGGVRFDLNNDGRKGWVSWTGPGSDDAWLALDRDGDGTIDGGAELFGDQTPQPPTDEPNGFVALAQYDRPEYGGNGDGVIEAGDAVYASLRLWQDTNHDGVSEPGELHPLPSLDVESISLGYRESRRRDRHGNEFRYRARVNGRGNHTTGKWAHDVFLLSTP